LLIRVILILAVALGGIYFLLETPYWLISSWIILALVFQVVELIRFHEVSSKALREFILSLKQEDFSSLTTINDLFDRIKGLFKKEIAKEGIQINVNVRQPGLNMYANPETLEQVFIPFFTTREDGSGIGLSLSRQIMQLHKGRIDVVSESGTGSCFTLEF
jgi:hypothetical protein